MKPIERALIIDDDPELLDLIEVSLRSTAGWAVARSASAGDVVRLVTTTRPDVILLDMMMPRVDGTDVLAELQSDPLIAHVPVIMLTADPRPQVRARCLALGAAGMIAKPFDPVELAEQTARIVEGWHSRGHSVPGASADAELEP